MTDATVLADLARRLDAVEARSEALEAENRHLRALLGDDRPAPTGPTEHADAAAPDDDRPLRRRALEQTGLTAANVAGAGARDTIPGPEAAGDPLRMGSHNTSTGATWWNMGGGFLGLDSEASTGVLQVFGTTASTFATQVSNELAGGGLQAWSWGSGTGVRGTSASGTGVHGSTDSWYGVHGEATTGTGVVGAGINGVSGIAAGAGAGVGVVGGTEGGVGVRALANSGVAFDATSVTGGGARLIAPRYQLQLDNATTRSAPTGDAQAHAVGELVQDSAGNLWHCSVAGTPGRWRKVGGPATAGALHVLATPIRVYDSRPGTAPTAVGPKTPFAAGTTRTFDLTLNASGVPVGASAALVTLSLYGAAATAGAVTAWAAGVTQPQATTLVWGGSAGRFATTALVALDTQSRIQVNASAATDLSIDVVGHHA